MLGIAIELLLSWVLLKTLNNRNLEALGLKPTKKRLFALAAGLLLPILLNSGSQWLMSSLQNYSYQRNPHYSIEDLLKATAYLSRSVLYENLIFCGAILYILNQKLKPVWGIVIVSAAFGVYHWFSFNVWGQPLNMTIVFFLTALGGLVFALSFTWTKASYLPFALHLGNDWTNMILFTPAHSSIGPQWLLRTGPLNYVASLPKGIFIVTWTYALLPLSAAAFIWLAWKLREIPRKKSVEPLTN